MRILITDYNYILLFMVLGSMFNVNHVKDQEENATGTVTKE